MSKNVITSAYIKRALLFICGKGKSGDIHFFYKNEKERFTPLYKDDGEDGFTACFDLASGYDKAPIPNGKWVLKFDGEIEADSIDSRDFSDNGGVYRIELNCNNDEISLISKLSPTKVNLTVKCADIILKTIFHAAKMVAKSNDRVLFTSQSRKDISGNEKDILDEILKRDKLKNRLKIKFSFTDKPNFKYYIKTAWMLGQSETIIIDDYHPIVYRFNYDKKVKIAQLWHACGAFKTFGYSRLGKEGSLRFDSNAHRCYTHAFVSGDGIRKYYAEAFGIPMECVYATGVPRCDNLKSTTKKDTDKFTILFAPTFRGNGKESAHYPFEMLNLDKLADVCRENNMQVIFKMHPFIKEQVPISDRHKDVLFDQSNLREVNDILNYADLVITDYSSLIYEAALLDKPMLFYTFDLDEYIATRDFYEPFEKFVPGKIVSNFDNLIKAIEKKEFDNDKVESFKQFNFSNYKFDAAKKIVDILFN
ncbi:MAG: CDP-glycerol glycerophosphotransferase family protein [Clostridia bacterium]|nr:CDP-glycerol glycerophosphotransferase family protein [Clostridia bacterium]